MSKQSKQPKYIQVGVTALRDPATGDFLPAVPIYILATPETKGAEQALIGDVSGVLADRLRQYVEGNERAGLKI